MSKVTLIRPATSLSKWAHTTPTCPPIGPAYLAASLREAGHEVELIDAIGEAVHQRTPIEGAENFLSHGLSNSEVVERIAANTEVIGLSCMFSQEWPLVSDLLQRIRERMPEVTIIGGGEHFTALPEESFRTCKALDYCVLGEGEETFVELVGAVAAGSSANEIAGIAYRAPDCGEAVRTRPRQRIRDLDRIPEPAWDLVPLDQYLDNGFGFGVNRGRSMPILATRGCPYQCTFCSNPVMWTTTWGARCPRAVVDEMKKYIELYNAENFDFYDLTAVLKKDWILEFGQMLIDEELDVTWQLPSGTRSEAIDEETADIMFRSGCRNLSYAPESGSPSVLKRIKKKIKVDRMLKSMRHSIRSGMNVKANIILGMPGETHGEVRETLWFIGKMAVIGVHDVSISPFSPYPGSELFSDLDQAGKIPALDRDYYFSLASYTDLSNTISYSDEISDRALSRYRLLGMAMFYAVSYLVRPWRLLATARNLFTRKHESRLEMSLHDLLVRVAGKAQPAKVGSDA